MNPAMIRSNLDIALCAEVVDPSGDHWTIAIRRPGEKPWTEVGGSLDLWGITLRRLARVLGGDKRWAVEVCEGGVLSGLSEARSYSVEADRATALNKGVRLALEIQAGVPERD